MEAAQAVEQAVEQTVEQTETKRVSNKPRAVHLSNGDERAACGRKTEGASLAFLLSSVDEAQWCKRCTPTVRRAAENDLREKAKVVVLAAAKEDADELEPEEHGLAALQQAKPRYRERGDVNNCGDWLAKTLKEKFHVGGKFDIESFTACLAENGVDLTQPFACSEAPGWQGRFRMNGRQKLEAVVAKNTKLLVRGQQCQAPRDFVVELRKKHPQKKEEIVDGE